MSWAAAASTNGAIKRFDTRKRACGHYSSDSSSDESSSAQPSQVIVLSRGKRDACPSVLNLDRWSNQGSCRHSRAGRPGMKPMNATSSGRAVSSTKWSRVSAVQVRKPATASTMPRQPSKVQPPHDGTTRTCSRGHCRPINSISSFVTCKLTVEAIARRPSMSTPV